MCHWFALFPKRIAMMIWCQILVLFHFVEAYFPRKKCYISSTMYFINILAVFGESVAVLRILSIYCASVSCIVKNYIFYKIIRTMTVGLTHRDFILGFASLAAASVPIVMFI
ncbi:hypothetical protein ACJX0J_034570 [Zea mays]